MKIVRKENGNILLTDASGNTVKRLPEYAVLELKRDTEGEFIRAAYGHQNKHDIYVSQITATQIEPDAEVTFSGTGQDLLNLLSTTFFFEVVGGGSPYIYKDPSTQTFLASNYVQMTTVAAVVNVIRGYFVTIHNDIEIIDINARVSVGSAGNSIFGMYEVGEDGYPTNKILESSIFNNTFSSQQGTTVNVQITAGTYFACYSSSSSATFFAFSAQSLYNPSLGLQGTLSTSAQLGGVSVAYTYTGSLPNSFPAGAAGTGNASLPAIVFGI